MGCKRQKIIKCMIDGLTAEETSTVVEDATITYIYRVRSDYKKKQNKIIIPRSYKKFDIIRLLNNKKLKPKDIAEITGCSTQYVYKVKNERHKSKRLVHDKVCVENDEYYTPLYAIVPIEKYLKRNSTIWCPFDTKDSLYVKYFRQQGHTIIHTHIDDGVDFFKAEPPEHCEYIISNPPYSCKDRVFKRLFEFGLPFGMLVNLTGLFTAKSRFDVFNNNKVEQMVFNSRVQYLTSYEDNSPKKYPPFESGYICSKILPDSLIFEEVDKKIINL